MTSEEKAESFIASPKWDDVEQSAALTLLLDQYADDQIDAIVSALKKELELYTPKDRMRHIVDICREASLTKRGK